MRILGEALAAIAGDEGGKQARPRGPDSGCPASAQVAADGRLAVAELAGDGAHRPSGLAQGEDLLGLVPGSIGVAHLAGGRGDWEVMSASSRDFLVIFSVPSRTALMAALRISQSRLPIIP